MSAELPAKYISLGDWAVGWQRTLLQVGRFLEVVCLVVVCWMVGCLELLSRGLFSRLVDFLR